MSDFLENAVFPDSYRISQLKEVCRVLELPFIDTRLLDQALTHRSFVNERGTQGGDYERLEFLGDSILGFLISERLFELYPDNAEGELSRMRAYLVSEDVLAPIASKLNIGKYLLLGRGEFASGGRERKSNLADALEAVVAALYLESGMEETRKFVIHIWKESIEQARLGKKDAKSELQEFTQKRWQVAPEYKLISDKGPDHKKEFVCSVLIQEDEISRGSGSSRKRAELNAAEKALKRIQIGDFQFNRKD